MKLTQEVTRLNLLLELVSECAGLSDLPGILRTLAARLHWILPLDACTLVAFDPEGDRYWLLAAGDEGFHAIAPDDLPTRHAQLVDTVRSTAAPSFHQDAPGALGYPLAGLERLRGALVVSTGGAFNYRDLRLLHHVCAGLGAVLQRISQQDALLRERDIAAAEKVRREHVEAASLAKDRFIAMLGHELRNPLAPIRSAVPLLRKAASAEQLPVVDILDRQSQHLHRLVEDLLDVSRITSGKIELQRRPVEVAALVGRALEMAQPRITEKNQVLEVRLAPEPLKVDADETRLVQVFANLLNNAVTYSPVGARIEVRSARDEGLAVVSVADTGIGFAPEALASMFEPFVQGETRAGLAPGGLGLGLAVARSLVELHDGTIHAASDGPGRGSCFTVRLPAVQERDVVAPAPSPASAGSAATPSLRVMLVDDNADAVDTLAELLRQFGHLVRVAYDPDAALLLLPEFDPDLVVLDIGLPKMDGYELGRRLRTARGDRPLALVALSGYGQESAHRKSRENGFRAHLVKPVDLNELAGVLAQLGPNGSLQ